MKNIKILIAVLLISSISIVTVNQTHATTQAVIWEHPSKAKKIGYSFSTTKTISRKELNQISKYFDDTETNKIVQAGIATTILTTPLSPKISISAGLGVTLLTSYVKTQGKMVSKKLKESSSKKFKVKISYYYRQTGSNDGYYSISKIKIYKK
ncbi:hypothetical protein ACIQ4I_03725 [Rummeliibacillus sp. NPDC094406]|uniref:hypothetical protein n=1 Tax=Rummeliibacillus sp. NPDC094406 TaxID=3364511 RepID=UPI003828B8D5